MACRPWDDRGDDRAIVRLVRGDVEHGDALDGGDRVANGGDDLGTTTLGEIRNELYETHEGGRQRTKVTDGGNDELRR